MSASPSVLRILCSLALAATVFAGEDPASLAKVKGKAEAAIKRYISGSRTRLNQLDRVVKSGDSISDEWGQICANAAKDLMDCKNDLDDIYKDKGGVKAVDEDIAAWIDSEATTWSNVASMGGELASEYWNIKSTSNRIRNFEIPAAENEAEWCDAKIAALDASAQVIVKLREGFSDEAGLILGGLDAARELLSQVDEYAENWAGQKLSAAVLQKYRVRIAGDLQRFKDAFNPDKYKSRIRAIIAKNIDPDQRGVFKDHEKLWEDELGKAADDFEESWSEYVGATKPLLETQITVTYAYFKAYSWSGLMKGYDSITGTTEEMRELLETPIEELEEKEEEK